MRTSNHLRLSFLTWNLYLGAGIQPPPDTGPTPVFVTEVFRQFLATNFPVRAKTIARQIAAEKPSLIGLQEAVRWELKIPNLPIVIYDFIQILLDELMELGLCYTVAAVDNNQFIELPDSNGNKISLLDRDAILIRKELKCKIIKRQTATFNANVPGLTKGWSAIDVKFGGNVFRMINTHLEPTSSIIREAQALELIEGPANTPLPLVLTGDLNSTPDSTVYRMFIDAGFRDAWLDAGNGLGLTCCQSPDLLNAVSRLSRRIDYILFKNGWKATDADIVGESQSDRTKTGLWPSDHAGVWAGLTLGNHLDDCDC